MTTVSPEFRLEQALRRAHAANLQVLGNGYMADGTSFRVVSSATDPNLHHVVKLAGRDFLDLECDCIGSGFGHVCSHVALVWESLRLAPRLSRKIEAMGGRAFQGILASR